MRLHRFYIGEKIGEAKELTIKDERLLHQWKNVFRMGVGERVILFDGSGDDFVCEILTLGKNEAELKITEKKKGIMPDRKVWLFFSLIKKDNAEMVLQKCTELGVSNFVPLVSERSEKKGLNIERAQKILIEASEQCGRSDIPELYEITHLEEALREYDDKIKIVAFDSAGEAINKLQITNDKMGLLTGPEGGWSENELILFKQKNIPVYSLGNLTLRAETAVIVAVFSCLRHNSLQKIKE